MRKTLRRRVERLEQGRGDGTLHEVCGFRLTMPQVRDVLAQVNARGRPVPPGVAKDRDGAHAR